MSATTSKKLYKAKLRYKKEWEVHYPWLHCTDPNDGMFCNSCQKYGNASAGSKGAWTTRGVKDWNHTTELVKQYMRSQWHGDAAVTVAIAEQADSGGSVLKPQCSSAAWEADERQQKYQGVAKVNAVSLFSCKELNSSHNTFQIWSSFWLPMEILCLKNIRERTQLMPSTLQCSVL